MVVARPGPARPAVAGRSHGTGAGNCERRPLHDTADRGRASRQAIRQPGRRYAMITRLSDHKPGL